MASPRCAGGHKLTLKWHASRLAPARAVLARSSATSTTSVLSPRGANGGDDDCTRAPDDDADEVAAAAAERDARWPEAAAEERARRLKAVGARLEANAQAVDEGRRRLSSVFAENTRLVRRALAASGGDDGGCGGLDDSDGGGVLDDESSGGGFGPEGHTHNGGDAEQEARGVDNGVTEVEETDAVARTPPPPPSRPPPEHALLLVSGDDAAALARPHAENGAAPSLKRPPAATLREVLSR